jgi:DUF1707 SHOCT-like domain
MRISDDEREQAVRMLGEHMSVGRLDVEEYGERTARATAAKTRGELTSLFTDLPDPRPTFGPVLPPPTQPAVPLPPPTASARLDERPAIQRVWAALVPLSAIAALVLFLSVIHVWWIFLLPAAFAVVGGALFGEDWKHDRRDFERRTHRRQLRRGWHD